MLQATAGGKIREAVGVFKDFRALESTIDELSREGFNRAEISLAANIAKNLKKLKRDIKSVRNLEDNQQAVRTAYIPTESIGEAEGIFLSVPIYLGAVICAVGAIWVGATMTVSVGVALIGGLFGLAIGKSFANKIENHHKQYLKEQMKKGGLVLWVRTWDKKHEQKALSIMKHHRGKDVHIHSIKAVT